MKKLKSALILLLACLCIPLSACTEYYYGPPAPDISLDTIPAYSGAPYVAVNGNLPFFEEDDLTTTSYETYSELDILNRCGVTMACVGTDIMPTEEREGIGQVKPTGWQTVKYDCVNGRYLYNRCHLIGFQLTGENSNNQNLITGTRYMNVEGMLPFENMVADYVKETGNHVLYRATPIFEGSELVARGVLLEAMSVEDGGEAICFNVYCYNVQPGVIIDYTDGDSWLESDNPVPDEMKEYVLNTNSMKFHEPDCPGAQKLAEKNKELYTGDRGELLDRGYSACAICSP
ncbi:MAG: DNA/RNA non-specific endonuclease [Ruminiclostridium sp.]|nr:DNA/RNA non-specific endonuclease [Ruminiclostridium sp.]